MNLDDSYQVDVSELYANIFNSEITARDREELLEVAAYEWGVILYSASKYSGTKSNRKIIEAGIIVYENVNITVRRSR